MLRIEHLSKTYGEKKAVDDLSLHIRPGEIYGFIGHNGAGKTTTIKSCAGILQFEQGEIYIDGKSVKADPLGCKQQLAYIPDNPDLYEFLSGVKYLNFVADIFGVSKTDREARIEKYADLFDLTGDLAQPISAYSHGMKQRNPHTYMIGKLCHEERFSDLWSAHKEVCSRVEQTVNHWRSAGKDLFIEVVHRHGWQIRRVTGPAYLLHDFLQIVRLRLVFCGVLCYTLISFF